MKVVIADSMDDKAQLILQEMGIEVDSRPAKGEIDLSEVIANADGLLIRSSTVVDSDLLAKSTNLKVVGRAGIGVDNVDIALASEQNVLVMNTPLANAVSTAEHAIGLLFSVSRMIPHANESTHKGKWEKKLFKGRELSNKNLGIIGGGNIGKIVADRAKGLRMNVLISDPFLTEESAKELGVTKVDLDTLCKTSDFITLHTPMTPDTKNIINKNRFSQMKKGVYIINAARGGLVNEADLKQAIDDGIVAGAALDVFEVEPVKTHILESYSNVIMTPHIAASTFEAQANVAIQIAEQVGNYLLNGDTSNSLNTDKIT